VNKLHIVTGSLSSVKWRTTTTTLERTNPVTIVWRRRKKKS